MPPLERSPSLDPAEGRGAVSPRRLVRRGSRLPLSFVVALAGCLLLSLAAGLGIPRSDEGPATLVLTGGSLVAGLGCLAFACVVLFRRLRRRAWLVVVPGVALLLVSVYSVSIALAASFPPRPAEGAVPAAAERVRMVAADDGVRLAGWYLPSRNGAAVVLRHGAGSTAAAVAAHAQILHEAGYGVLATDARGHGASDGRGMDLGWYGESDIRAAIDLLESRSEVDPGSIAVVGLSMGGEEAIGAAGADDRIRAVVAEGATGRTADDKAWLPEEYGLAGHAQRVLDAVTYTFVAGLTRAPQPETLAESVRTSASAQFLLIAAGTVPDEQAVASRLADAAPGRVQVWVVPDARHVGALDTAGNAWAERVIGFLDDALRADGLVAR